MDHLFGGDHAGSEMVTDGQGHLISQTHPDGGGVTYTDASGQDAGRISDTHHGEVLTNMAGQQVARIASDTIFDGSNIPIGHILSHGNLTDITDAHGDTVGRILRGPSGDLIFDGAYPPHELGVSTKI